MKIDLRWQLLLAAVCLLLVFSILNVQNQVEGQCVTSVPASGGTVSHGMHGQPTYINPLLSELNPVDRELVDLIFDGLLRYDLDGYLQPALAESYSVSEDGRTVTFSLREDVAWHDGTPFTAADVAFTYGLLKDEEFPASEREKQLWQSVAISPTTDYEISFQLPQPYAPFLEATTVGILPEHRLEDVPSAEIPSHPFNQMPVGTGPFRVVPGTNWQRQGYLTLAPNPDSWSKTAALDVLRFYFYPNPEALINAFREGEIQAIVNIPFEVIDDAGTLPDIKLYTSGFPLMTQLLFNLSESATSAIQSLDVRKAIAYGLDRQKLVQETLQGQGLPLDGPYLSTSWAYNDNLMSEYSHKPETANGLLDNLGWTKSEGSDVRIKDGEELVLKIVLADRQRYRWIAEDVARQLGDIGIRADLILTDPQDMNERLMQGDFDLALVDVNPGKDPDLYDFWSQEAIIAGQNYGSWNNRRASEALETARRIFEVEQRKPYYDQFLGYYENDLPALTLYQHTQTFGMNDIVKMAEIGVVLTPRDRYISLADWFIHFRNVPIPCPPTVEQDK